MKSLYLPDRDRQLQLSLNKGFTYSLVYVDKCFCTKVELVTPVELFHADQRLSYRLTSCWSCLIAGTVHAWYYPSDTDAAPAEKSGLPAPQSRIRARTTGYNLLKGWTICKRGVFRKKTSLRSTEKGLSLWTSGRWCYYEYLWVGGACLFVLCEDRQMT